MVVIKEYYISQPILVLLGAVIYIKMMIFYMDNPKNKKNLSNWQ